MKRGMLDGYRESLRTEATEGAVPPTTDSECDKTTVKNQALSCEPTRSLKELKQLALMKTWVWSPTKEIISKAAKKI